MPAVAGSAGCGDSATNPLEVPVIITLTAAIDTFHSIGQRVQLEVVATDSVGNPHSTAFLSCVTSDEGVLQVSGPGLVTSVGNGTATITASIGASSGTIALAASQRVATLSVSGPADTIFSLGIRSRFVADAVDLRRASRFRPGTGWSASQTGYYLLGMIAEAVTGSTVRDELRSRFWEPLGLTNIYMDGRESPPGLVAGSRRRAHLEEAGGLLARPVVRIYGGPAGCGGHRTWDDSKTITSAWID